MNYYKIAGNKNNNIGTNENLKVIKLFNVLIVIKKKKKKNLSKNFYFGIKKLQINSRETMFECFG